MRTVLVIAAEPFELKWIVPPPEIRFVKVAGGAGPGLAAAALEAAAGEFDAVLSTGLCGALDPALKVGEIFVADSVNRDPVKLPAAGRSYVSGPLMSVDRIIDTAAEKRALFASGFRAVEMEAAAALRHAKSLGIAFYCIRAVSDTATEEFVSDLNAARDEAGRIRAARILAQAARRPFRILPELVRLRRNAMTAARALGAFIATCDF